MDKTLERAIEEKKINSKAHDDVITGKKPTSKDSFYMSCYKYWTSLMVWFYSLEYEGRV